MSSPGESNKDIMLRILIDKNLTAKRIAMMCIHHMTDEQLGDMIEANQIYTFNEKHEVIT